MAIYTIYKHEENYDEMVAWLKERAECTKIITEEGEFLGIQAFLTGSLESMFREAFDLIDFDEAKNQNGF